MVGKIFKVSVNVVLLLLVMLGIFVVFSFVPFPGNYKIFTVQSGSMEPAIKTGSMIFVKPMDSYGVDDVVTRRTSKPSVTVTHRIVEEKEEQGQKHFITKGDANDAADGEKVYPSEIIGKAIFEVPIIGYAVSYARTTPGFILLVVIPAVIIIYDEAQNIKNEVKRKLAYKKRAQKRKENEQEVAVAEEKIS